MEKKGFQMKGKEEKVEEKATGGLSVQEQIQLAAAQIRAEFEKEIERLNAELANAKAAAISKMPDVAPEATDADVIEFRFTNIESPGAHIDFVYGGQPYRFLHGHIHKAPKKVLRHLNNLCVPIHSTELDEVTGQLRTNVLGVNNRFSCIPTKDF